MATTAGRAPRLQPEQWTRCRSERRRAGAFLHSRAHLAVLVRHAGRLWVTAGTEKDWSRKTGSLTPQPRRTTLDRNTSEGGPKSMSWKLEGSYFENCNCDWVCPCSVTSFGSPATGDRCQVVLNYHVRRGEIDGVDVSGHSVSVVADT